MAEQQRALHLMRADVDRLVAGGSVATLTDWVVFQVLGEDALEWFQGQATNDLRSLASQDVLIESCLCSATGQLTAIFLFGRFKDQLYMVTPIACASEILQRVEKMVILEEVELEKTSLVAQIHASPSEPDTTPTWSTRLLLEKGLSLSLVPQEATSERAELSEEAVEGLMVLSGTPRFGQDTHAKTLPPELGPDFDTRFVHYAKGCYMGQEVLQRIHSRGHTNKTWVQIEVPGAIDLVGPFSVEGLTNVPFHSDIRLDSGTAFLGTVLRNELFEYGKTMDVIDSAGNSHVGTVRRMPIYPFA